MTKPTPPAMDTPPPIEAIREAIRAELTPIAHSVSDIAMRAAAAGLVGARLASAQGLLHAVAALLAIRLLLLLALLGGFALSVMALHAGTYQADGLMVAYAVLFILPLVWLERHQRVVPPVGAK